MPTKSGSRKRSTGGEFIARIGLSDAGSIRVRFSPAPPTRSMYGSERRLAALIYDLAAELERRSEVTGARWAIAPEPFNARIDVEMSDDADAGSAAELVAALLAERGLTE